MPLGHISKKTTEVEIKKEHAIFMVNQTIEFKKSGKKDKGKKGGKPVVTPRKAPKHRPNPGVECFYCKGDGHWKRNCPKYLEDKKAGKIDGRDKGIFYIHVLIFS